MIPQMLSMIAQVAPESYEVIKTLMENKVKDRDILITLLALNLEQTKKLSEMSTCLVDIRVAQVKAK